MGKNGRTPKEKIPDDKKVYLDFTIDKMLMHIRLLEDHFLDITVDRNVLQCISCSYWHLFSLAAYDSLERPKFDPNYDTRFIRWLESALDLLKEQKLTRLIAHQMVDQLREWRYFFAGEEDANIPKAVMASEKRQLLFELRSQRKDGKYIGNIADLFNAIMERQAHKEIYNRIYEVYRQVIDLDKKLDNMNDRLIAGQKETPSQRARHDQIAESRNKAKEELRQLTIQAIQERYPLPAGVKRLFPGIDQEAGVSSLDPVLNEYRLYNERLKAWEDVMALHPYEALDILGWKYEDIGQFKIGTTGGGEWGGSGWKKVIMVSPDEMKTGKQPWEMDMFQYTRRQGGETKTTKEAFDPRYHSYQEVIAGKVHNIHRPYISMLKEAIRNKENIPQKIIDKFISGSPASAAELGFDVVLNPAHFKALVRSQQRPDGGLMRGTDYYGKLLSKMPTDDIREVRNWARDEGGYIARFLGAEANAQLRARGIEPYADDRPIPKAGSGDPEAGIQAGFTEDLSPVYEPYKPEAKTWADPGKGRQLGLDIGPVPYQVKLPGGGYATQPTLFSPFADEIERILGVEDPDTAELEKPADLAGHLRKTAEAMQAQIDNKLDPSISHQNPTARRARIAEGMFNEGLRLQKIQSVLNGMADAIDAGELPASLEGVTNRAQVEQILLFEKYYPPEIPTHYIKDIKEGILGVPHYAGEKKIFDRIIARNPEGYHIHLKDAEEVKAVETLIKVATDNGNRFAKWARDTVTRGKRLWSAGIRSQAAYDKARAALLEYTRPVSPDILREREIKRLENELLDRKIPGFFPTPRPVIDAMLERADIQDGMKILEPSAGKGDIADVIRYRYPETDLTLIEYNGTLVKILKAKGYNPIFGDFMDHEGKYDRIIMNPPFEKGADIDHVRHAYDLLRPGGRVISIMCEGPFFRSDTKSNEFRNWFDDLGGEYIKLDPGSFQGSEAFRQTGVNSRMVVLDKYPMPSILDDKPGDLPEIPDPIDTLIESNVVYGATHDPRSNVRIAEDMQTNEPIVATPQAWDPDLNDLLGWDTVNIREHHEKFYPAFHDVQQILEELFAREKVEGRVKTLTSVVKKLKKKNIGGEAFTHLNLEDIAGLRVTFKNLGDILPGVEKIHRNLNVIQDEDYITQPKSGYRSYHLTVKHNGYPVEIQLRTPNMTKWADWQHDRIYDNIEDTKRRIGEKGLREVQAYALAMSGYYELLDKGLPATLPPVPPVVVYQLGGGMEPLPPAYKPPLIVGGPEWGTQQPLDLGPIPIHKKTRSGAEVIQPVMFRPGKNDLPVKISGKCLDDDCSLKVTASEKAEISTTSLGDLPKLVKTVRDSIRSGKKGSSKTIALGPNGVTRYEFEYQILDVNSLVTSHNPFTYERNKKYPQDLQPRLRERAATKMQVERIAANLDPDAMISDFRSLDRGAPIIGPDNIVESGNGRIMALVRAIDYHPDRYKAYVEHLKSSLGSLGLSEKDLNKIKTPCLVRKRLTKVDRQAFVQEANAATTIESSAIEKARTDAEKITYDMITAFDIGDAQTIEDAVRSSRNINFVRSFLDKLPANEQAQLVDAKGNLSQDGVRRIVMGLFVSAFTGDAGLQLAERFFESTDVNVKNIFNGIAGALGRLAMAEAMIRGRQRYEDYTIEADIAKAVSVFSAIKKTPGGSVKKYLQQQQMFERELTPFQEDLLEILEKHSRSGRRIRTILAGYANRVIESNPPDQISMLPAWDRPQKADFLRQAVAEAEDREPVLSRPRVDLQEVINKIFPQG